MTRTLIRAEWVLPISQPPIENGAVLIEDDRIVAVDGASAFEGVVGVERELGGDQTWLLPGFVNSHYHSARSFQLGYSDEPGEIGLFRTFSHAGLADASEAADYSYLNTLVSACQLLRSGVTSLMDMAWGGRSAGVDHRHAIQAYQDLGLAVIFAPIARDRAAFVYGDDEEWLATLPPALADRIRAAGLGQSTGMQSEAYTDEWQDLYDAHDDGDRIRMMVALDGPVWCSDDLVRQVASWARRHSLPVQLHNAESKLEVNWALDTLGQSTTAHLLELGLPGPLTSFAHGIWVSDDDMRLAAAAGVSIAHTPASDLRWYAGIAPIVDWLQRGVNVGIGTDGNSLTDYHDFLEEMRLASFLQRVPGDLEWPGLSPETVLQMATLNGARMFGLQDRVGSLEPGKRADVVLIDGQQVRGPLISRKMAVPEVLVQCGRAEHVQAVLIGGQLCYQAGQVLTVDEPAAIRRLRRYYERFWQDRDPDREQLIRAGLEYVRKYFAPWEATVFPVRYRYNRR